MNYLLYVTDTRSSNFILRLRNLRKAFVLVACPRITDQLDDDNDIVIIVVIIMFPSNLIATMHKVPSNLSTCFR